MTSSDFLARFTGLSTTVLTQCELQTQRQVLTLGLALFFTPFISALLMGFAFAWIIFKDLWWWLPIMILWFCLEYLLDRAVLGGRGGRWLFVFRGLLVLVLMGWHALVFDVILFQRDILELHQQDILEKQERVATTLSLQITELESRQRALMDRNSALEDTLLQWREKLRREGDGTGGSRKRGTREIYFELKESVVAIESRVETEKSRNQKEIDRIERRTDTLNKQIALRQRKLAESEAPGLLSRFELLHRIVFEKKRHTVVLAFLLIAFLVGILESLPMVCKVILPISDYHDIQRNAQQSNLNLAKYRRQYKEQLELEAMLIDYRRQQQARVSRALLKEQQVELEEIEAWLEQELAFLDRLARREKAIAEELPLLYARYGRDLAMEALDRFLQKTRRSKRHSA
jgi:hypothetical protein